MKQNEAEVVREQMRGMVAKMAERFSEVVAGPPEARRPVPPMAQIYFYEANRRMEEVLHRVSDCLAVLIAVDQETIDKAVVDAIQTGKAVTPDGAAVPPMRVMSPEE